MLHILINSPFKVHFCSVLRLLNPTDDLIALQDGVLISLKNNLFLEKIIQSGVNLHLLKEDVSARGILDDVSDKFCMINYSQFIILTEKHKLYMYW